MMEASAVNSSRRLDVTALRGIAIAGTVAFHYGWLGANSTGMSIFLVVSGFLLTRSLIRITLNDARSGFIGFYRRRIRRTLPLMTSVLLATLVIGYLVMLPDDLENLAEATVASSFYAENILAMVTVGDYWVPANMIRPLMHIWFVGVLLQICIIYPLGFMLVKYLAKKRKYAIAMQLKLISAIICIELLASVTACFATGGPEGAAYFNPFYRAAEFLVGGVAASITYSSPFRSSTAVKWMMLSLLVVNMLFLASWLSLSTRIGLTCLLSAGLLMMDDFKLLAKCAPLVLLGEISFSLYLWHYPVIAFTRYLSIEGKANFLASIVAIIVSIVIAVVTYRLIERRYSIPRLGGQKMRHKPMWIAMWSIALVVALAIYGNAGVVRDIPNLGIKASLSLDNFNPKAEGRTPNSRYNDHIYGYSRAMPSTKDSAGCRLRTLIVGNSQARDWANVLLCHPHLTDSVYLCYREVVTAPDLNHSDIVFATHEAAKDIPKLLLSKVYVIGVKEFPQCYGGYYMRYRLGDDTQYRHYLTDAVIRTNDSLAKLYGDRYINILGMLSQDDMSIPVSTPDSIKFMSTDGLHLTPAGAKYIYSKIISRKGGCAPLDFAPQRAVSPGVRAQ